jgi:two-component system cell cycle response regulator DivK
VTRPKILIVEDDPHNRELLVTLLERHGYSVITAADGQEGVNRARLESPDLIIMDMQLPVVDGYEAVRRIRSDPATSKTPILAVTAYARPQDAAKTLAAGCNGYISKPIKTRELPAKVNALLSKK